MKRNIKLLIILFLIQMSACCTVYGGNSEKNSLLDTNEHIEDGMYEKLEFSDEGDEFVVNLSLDQYKKGDDILFYIYREYRKVPGHYNFMIRGRVPEIDEQGKIHIEKNQEIIGVWNEKDEEFVSVPWLSETNEEGKCWKTQNFYLMHDRSCDLLSESNKMNLVLRENADGSIAYEYTVDEEEKNQPVRNGNTFCLAEGDRLPTYTTTGILKEYTSWDSEYISASVCESENPALDLKFCQMKLSDFPEETYTCQIAVKKSDGSFLTTDFMMLQEGVSEKKQEKSFKIDTKNGSMTFSIEDGSAMLVEYSGTDDKVSIPDRVEGYPVTVIGENAFEFSSILQIELPETIKEIQANAFQGSALTGICIPAKVEAISESCFVDCVSLKDIRVEEKSSFFQMIGNGLYSKDGKILYKVNAETQGVFEIPKGVEEIGGYAFSDADIQRVVFPDTLRRIGMYAFENVTLEELKLPDSLEVISAGAFSGCYAYVDDNWEKAGYSKETISSKTIPEIQVSIGKKVEYIGPEAFSGLYIKEFVVDDENIYYKSGDGMLLTKDGKYLLECPTGKGGNLSLPEGIEIVQKDAFSNNGAFSERFGDQYQGIVEMTLPSTMKYFDIISIPFDLKYLYKNDGLLSINEDSMVNLHNVRIRSVLGNENIIDGALISDDGKKLVSFSEDNLMLSFTIPDSVTEIYQNALHSNCLKKLVFPAGLTLSDMTAYDVAEVLKNLNNLEEIIVEEDNKFFCSIDGVLYTKDGSILISYPREKKDIDFSIPEGVKAVVADAFYKNEYIESLSIPSSFETLQLKNDYKIYLNNLKTLKNLSVSEKNHYYAYVDGMLISKQEHSLVYYVDNRREVVVIPDGIEIINEGVSFGIENNEDVDPWSRLLIELPVSLKEIQGNPFKNSTYLKLRVHSGSYGENYAIENELDYELLK